VGSPRPALAAIVVVIAVLVSGCSGAPSASTAPTAATPSRSPAPTPSPEPPTPAPTDIGPHLSLVGLGDSVPGGLKCNDPCQSYVLSFGDLAAVAMGEVVVTTNLATNDNLASSKLLARIRGEEPYQTAIAGADIVTLQVGWNDWQGPCNFGNRASCLPLGIGRVRPNVEAILDEIATLRAGEATAIRVVTYYNGYLGNDQTPAIWQFAGAPSDIEAFDREFRAALADFNAMLCDVAVAHGALCVEVGPAFNGKRLDEPAAPGLINSDGIHGLRAGQALIATILDGAGYAPLQ